MKVFTKTPNLTNDAQDVALQDQYTPTVIVEFNKQTNETTLSVLAVIDEYTITVTSTTGIGDGTYLILFNPTAIRYATFYVVGAPAGNVVTLDSPIDFDFPVGTFISATVTNMAVDGSTTPEVFGIRGVESANSLNMTIHIKRLIIECITNSPVNLALFGDLPKLTNGLVIRERDGIKKNQLNVKSNAEIAGKMLDWTPYAALNPVQGVDGFISCIDYDKLGIVINLAADEDLETWIQDDLATAQTGAQILNLKITAEGHVVE